MARKILTSFLNKKGNTGGDEGKFYLFRFKLKRRFYWLRFKIELFFTTKISLKHKYAKKTIDDFTKSCNDLGNGTLLEPIKDFKPEVIFGDGAIDWRIQAYKNFKKSIDEGKPVMYIDLGEGK